MKPFALPLLAASLLVVTGCARHTYVAVAPPPPPGYAEQAPPLIQVAERNGFRAGSEAGSRDAATGRGYHPQHDRAFHETPGYDPSLGPLPAYRSAFRSAYIRGYEEGSHHPHGMQ
jgi:hypothetical protein